MEANGDSFLLIPTESGAAEVLLMSSGADADSKDSSAGKGGASGDSGTPGGEDEDGGEFVCT